MAAQTAPAGPTPERIFETLTGYQRTSVLRAAIELNLFTSVGEGANTIAALAKRCNASERGLRMLCDSLTVMRFLAKQDQSYSLTEESATFLDRRSPACLASIAGFMTIPKLMDAFDDLANVVRSGQTGMGKDGTLAPEDPIWVDFARSMGPLQAPFAEVISQILGADAGERWKVLDIAAGHGVFGITLAKHNPHAEIFAVDWPDVLKVAAENARTAGVSARHHGVPGNAFEVNFGSGYDVILLTGFLHHFDPPKNEKLLRKVHAALAQNGRVITLEFVPNEDRVTPPQTAAWVINMLATTPSGDAYTFSEFDRMFRNAGFSSNGLRRLPFGPQSVILSRK
jgi:ubiquinone/menaquinone biosynthesis C-methylase UbiE